jgi:integrase
MRGHIAKKGKRYYPVLDEYDVETGARRRRWHEGCPTKREAEALLHRVLSEMERGVYVSPARTTLAQYLEGEWLPAIASTLRPSTLSLYTTIVKSHVTPYIGSKRLQKLRPSELNGLYASLLEKGGRNGDALSPKTVRNVHTTLHAALRDAVRWGYLANNPADAANPPRLRSQTMRTWTAAEIATFLDHVREDRLFAAWTLLATTGMRRGEVLGLKWVDLDLEAGRAAVQRSLVLAGGRPVLSEPKTARSRRSVPLPGQTIAALRDHRRRQAEERLALGPGYEDQGFVFCREDGRQLDPHSFSERFKRRVTSSGLPRIRIHDLRHTFATLALQGGVNPKVVSEILGHANIGITLDTYSHAIPAMQEQAATLVADLIFRP